mgnify:FL=1
MIEVQLYTPLPYQNQVIDYVIENPKGRQVTVHSARQQGKSITLSNILSYFSLTTKKRKSVFFSPTYKQAKTQMSNIVDNLGPVCQSNFGDMMIEFPNTGSRIQFLSGEMSDEALRGYTCSGLMVYDEAAFLAERIFEVTRPYTIAHHPTTIYISTPKFRRGTFYDRCMDETVQHFRWHIEETPYITNEDLEQIRRQTPPNIFRSEYLGEWLEESSDVFGDFSGVIEEHADYQYTYGGIDWATGTGNDATVLTLFNESRQMVMVNEWRTEPADVVIERICELCNQYNTTKLTIELNSIGHVFGDLLEKRLRGTQTKLVKFTTTNETKRTIVEDVILAIQNKELTLLNNDQLLYEMAAFQVKSTPSGKVTYSNDKDTSHDDYVMSLCIAYHNFKTGSGKLSFL